MNVTPQSPRCELGAAADDESGLELRLSGTSADKSQALARLRRQRHVEQIHRLGARAVFEFIDELARHHGLGDDLDRRLERYARLDPEVLRALRANTLPALPLRLVGSSR